MKADSRKKIEKSIMSNSEHRRTAFSSLLRPAMILSAFAAGGFIPSAAAFAWLTRYLLMAMLFLIFLRVKIDRIRPRATHWRILAANLFIALAVWLAVRFLSGSEILAHAAFFTAVCPTAAAAPVIMKFLGGNAEFVLTSFLVTNLGIPIALTVLIPLVTGEMTWSFLVQVAMNLLVLIGVPMALALLLRKKFPVLIQMADKSSSVSFLMWIAMLFLAAASASDSIRSTPGLSFSIFLQIAALTAVICFINFSLGYLLSEKRCRHEASQSLGQKNTMLLICLALTFGGPISALGPTSYILWHNLWNALQMFLHDRKTARRRQRLSSSGNSGTESAS